MQRTRASAVALVVLAGWAIGAGCGETADAPAGVDWETILRSKADSLFALPAADQPGGIDAVKAFARARVKVAQEQFNGTRMPSPTTWADQVVYQIQVDRFADGDRTNNHQNVSAYQTSHESRDQRGLADYYHGGDLQGIIDRLDYLADLGVTTLWITPVLKSAASYHGYCTSSLTELDPNFGTEETLRTLTRKAHQRGMRVVLDIVVNHMCSDDTHYDDQRTPFQDWAYGQCTNDQNYKRWNGGNSVRGQRELVFGPSFFAPLRHKSFFSRCGFKPGDATSEGPGAMFGDFTSSMLDFDTMNWDFQEIFTELHKYWIAYADIDGFRVDAAKHVTEDFLAYLSTELRSYATQIGKQNFFLVGEVASSTYEQALRVGRMRSNYVYPEDRSAVIPESLRARLVNLRAKYLANKWFLFPGLNAVYDFGHSGTAVDVLHQKRAPIEIKRWYWAGDELDHSQYSQNFAELAANGEVQLNWNILEIHDWPRFAERSRSMPELEGALGYLLTAMGTPVLYYGVEQGFDGNCPFDKIGLPDPTAKNEVLGVCTSASHARYRQDMFSTGPWRLRSLVDSVDRLAGIGLSTVAQTAPASDPYLRQDHWLYQWTRRLTAVRKSCRALRYGRIYFRAAHQSSAGGLLAFSRIVDGEEALVLVNTSGNSIPVQALALDAAIHAGRDFDRFYNLLNAAEQGTVGKLGGGMGLYLKGGLGGDFVLKGRGVAIFVNGKNLAPFDARLGANLCQS